MEECDYSQFVLSAVVGFFLKEFWWQTREQWMKEKPT
jgi:hypothetical protein